MALHGRDADLALIDEILVSAGAGRGRAVFFTGEPGIGKSTLLREARTRAQMTVLAGAAWESGGAPPYWPWLQVLRDAAERFGERVRSLPGAERIAALVPEWSSGQAAAPDAPDPAAARFALLDAVARAFVALSNEQPLVILLDDLHAADLPTLDLLVQIVRELPRAAIALVAAWRDGELALRRDAAQRLARASRHGTVQGLRRLTAEEVARWVGADGAAMHATTEGNPLFVEETLRSKRGGVAALGIDAVLADHLALASASTREVLDAASVLGRDLDQALVHVVCGRDEDAVASALREAAALGIVEKRDASWSFRHVLLRDHLYNALPPSQRVALHRALGEALEHVAPAQAAHHLLAGLSGRDVSRAVSVARAAAAQATAIYGFEDAALLLAAASRAHESASGSDATGIDLRIELAEAYHRLGSGDRARSECVRAAELARVAGDAERLGRAALVYASELLTGRRDPTMIALLEQAHALLPPGDSSLRARVTARLGASLIPVPFDDPRPDQLADDAVAMARRLGDDETIMYTLRFASHAHGYKTSIRDALPPSLEAIALSDRLGRPLELLEHRIFLFSAYLALGERAAANAAAESVMALLERLPQPHYRWRVPILRAALATLRGDYDDADRLVASARVIANEYGIDRAQFACMFASLSIVASSRSCERAEAVIDDVRDRVSRVVPYASGVIAFPLAVAGRADEARALLGPHTFVPALVLTQFAAEAAILVADRELAVQALEVVLPLVEKHPIAFGHSASLVLRPVLSMIAELLLLTGRRGEALAAAERGLALARAMESPPFIADALAVLERARGAPQAAQAPARSLSITRIGDEIRVCWAGRELVAPCSKGLDYLATLVSSPGHEVHVSDLVGDDDRGDAGEVLDAKARASYKQRADDLRAELDRARERNDLGRVELLTTELDAITDELIAGTGLGGRARKAGSRIERARVNVQRRIKDAIRRLAGEDEALGKYLEATVRTGTFCMFEPV